MTNPQLADVLPAVAHLLGVRREEAGSVRATMLPGTSASHIVVLLVDGLGALQLEQHRETAPHLSAMFPLGSIDAPFPATTAVSLTSLGTGLPPGMHGIVGTQFRLDDGSTLAPLSWGATPNPIATQPEPTVLEQVAAAGVQVTSVAPGAYRTSGLTRAALRGGDYVGAQTRAERVRSVTATVSRAQKHDRRSMTYVYWPELDKAGHVHGVASDAYRTALGEVDRLVAELLELTNDDVALLVTADHGLVDVPADRLVDIEANPGLRHGVVTILGEPRVRHVYTQAGRADDVLRIWRSELSGIAEVRTRAEIAQLLGPLEEWYDERVGDVVAIASADWALASHRVDRVVSGLRGQHGGLTPDEVLVPLQASWNPGRSRP